MLKSSATQSEQCLRRIFSYFGVQQFDFVLAILTRRSKISTSTVEPDTKVGVGAKCGCWLYLPPSLPPAPGVTVAYAFIRFKYTPRIH